MNTTLKRLANNIVDSFDISQICENCQYFREPSSLSPKVTSGNPTMTEIAGMWCSNSASYMYRSFVCDFDTCVFFTKKKKAPFLVRLGKKMIEWLK